MEEIPIGELFEDCLRSSGSVLRDSGIALEMILEDPWVKVRGDRQLLKAALGNLITYAANHVRPGGRITLAYECDSMRESITVCGDGNDIDYDELRSLLDLFSRPGSRAMDNGGEINPRLVGLSIVRDVMDLHGGRVGLRKQEGEGLVYTMHLPRRCA